MLRRSRGVETCPVAIMKAGEQPVVMVRWWNHAGIETTELSGGGSSDRDRRDWPGIWTLTRYRFHWRKRRIIVGPYSSRERGLRATGTGILLARCAYGLSALLSLRASTTAPLPPSALHLHDRHSACLYPPGIFGTARRSMPPDRPASRQPAKRGGRGSCCPCCERGIVSSGTASSGTGSSQG